ncbi:TauD/TfdA family dioxygenase [Burkholderia gladioli]|uniref:TauD/TfdA family dioxygenase n=1 Tax=Burkholderia gladioli TaxID=28095 RepID=UPI001641123A|nr:TauD/TfdA family dioxygenase [Burkholderia gladioli]
MLTHASDTAASAAALETEILRPEHDFMMMVRAEAGTGTPADWARQHRDFLRESLLKYGAVLIRGLQCDRDSFSELSRVLEPKAIDYKGGIGPRRIVAEEVFTSTDLPPEASLASHNEMSYGGYWPMRVLFFCEQQPEDRGQTTICDARRLLKSLPAALRTRLAETGVQYTRNISPRGPVKSIEQTFGTTDHGEIEAFCAERGIRATWLADDHLQLRQHTPAIRRHPLTGDEVFFNTLALWHPVYWRDVLKRAFPDAADPSDEDEMWQNSHFGDGKPFDDEDIRAVLRAYEEQEFAVEWQPSDIVYIDNMLASHGRRVFSGKRSILASFRAPMTAQQLSDGSHSL